MKITDKKVLKWLKTLASCDLDEMIELYPENERDGRSDIQIFADELSYCISNYNEDGHTWHDDLIECRRILNVTKYGKSIPVNPKTFKPIYRPSDIMIAKDTVNEYKRMIYRYNQLKKIGIHGRWYD